MVFPFPVAGDGDRLSYRGLHIVIKRHRGTRKALGGHALLPRPLEPTTCLDPELRHDLWKWLEDVVIRLNREYTRGRLRPHPGCWPVDPHLVHEIAVLADQRRRAGLALTIDALEEWHRYCLTAFTDRIRDRLRAHCDDEHKIWPAQAAAQRASGRRQPPAKREHRRPRHRRAARQPAGPRAARTGQLAAAGRGRPRHRRDQGRPARCASAHPY